MVRARESTKSPWVRLKRAAAPPPLVMLLLCMVIGLSRAPSAAAQERGTPQRAAKSPYMPLGEPMTPPFSFLRFCDRKPERCPVSAEVRKIPLTAQNRRTLENVQSSVNRELRAGLERWRDDATRTDCTDFALTTRSRLLDTGFPASALLVAVAFVPSGEGHLVAVVVTDQGDFVLDNLRATVVRWDQLPYRWAMRSSPRDPRQWQSILPRYIGPGFENFPTGVCE